MFSVFIIDCPEHDNCSAHVCESNGEIIWTSHMDASIDDEPRLNPDFGEVDSYRD